MKKKKITLALQGGGAHGAYTWGVLEKLLEEDVLDFRGICGTSAGAANAVVMVHGLQKGGNKGAIELLEKFWKEVSISTSTYIWPAQQFLDNNLFKGNMDYSPYYQFFSYVTGHLSPSQFNPMGINPFEAILDKLIDFEELKTSDVKLFAGATNVRTGSPKVFSLPEMSVKALLASTCLPTIFKTVEINKEYYWDGGYSGNPPIAPLIYGTDCSDVLLIQIIPLNRDKVPVSVTEISNRVNEISFNTALRTEMRMLMHKEVLAKSEKKAYFHWISSNHLFNELDFSSTLNTSWDFFNRLRKAGRTAAMHWLESDLAHVGNKTCPMLEELFGQVEKDWMFEMVHKPAIEHQVNPEKGEG